MGVTPMKLLAVALVALGFIAITAGAGLIYMPAGLLIGGALLMFAGMHIDYDRGGKRATDRRGPRK